MSDKLIAPVLNNMALQKKVEEKLKQYSPYTVMGGTALALSASYKLYQMVKPCWEEEKTAQIGRWLMSIPSVQKEYKAKIIPDLQSNRQKYIEKWQRFGEPITELPKYGWSPAGLKALVDKYCEATNVHLITQCMSGTIYSNSYTEADTGSGDPSKIGVEVERKFAGPDDLADLAKELKGVYTYAFEKSYLWNSLHGNEFGIGDYISYQVVQMVGSMFGAKKEEIMGFITSGGTESLMLAIRCYRNWGVRERGHLPGQGVIVAGDTVHAAVMKAGEAYNLQVKLAPCNPDGTLDLAAYKKLVKSVGNDLIAIVGSGPSYPTGVIDDIEALGKVALEAGVGLHVDCCLGGFVVNNLSHKTDFLSIPGVVSLSADTHKNGWAPKGSSVCIMRRLSSKLYGDTNLAYHSIYAIPGWSGGVYGTPKDPGSQSCVAALHALLAMLGIGQSGYTQIAESINESCKSMNAVLKKFPEFVVVTDPPQVNVVTWKLDEKMGWGKGAIYAVAYEMDQRGFTLSALKGDMVHFCVTGRLAGNAKLMQEFEQALRASLDAMQDQVKAVLAGEAAFRGDAGMYGMLEDALDPANSTQGGSKKVENLLFGQAGAQDAVRAYFMAGFNPYSTASM